jgi:hypothetical protein
LSTGRLLSVLGGSPWIARRFASPIGPVANGLVRLGMHRPWMNRLWRLRLQAMLCLETQGLPARSACDLLMPASPGPARLGRPRGKRDLGDLATREPPGHRRSLAVTPVLPQLPQCCRYWRSSAGNT